MANNETLGASFSIDVTDLKAGLAQANRMIRESESEFKAAAAGMDDWRESQDGLNAKIKSLNSITDVQKKKVNALKAEYDRMIKDGLDPTSKAAVDLRTKINNETAALNKNEAELKQQKQALADLGKETQETAAEVDEMGNSLEGLQKAGGIAATALAAVGAACVAAVGAFFGLAESTREYRREMAQLAQNAGDSGADLDTMKDKLAEVAAVTGEADAAMEGMNMLMATGLDTSEIEAASDALAGAATRFDGLKFEGMAEGLQETLATGVAVGPFAELIERTGGDLEAFNAQLAGCTTEAERQAVALKFLADSGLAEANAEYKAMNGDLYNAELAQYKLNDALAELGAIAEPIMTSLKVLATDLLTSITPFVSLIGEGLAGALAGADGAAETLAEGLGGLISAALEKIVDLAPFLIETILSLVPTLLQELVAQLPSILQTLSGIILSVAGNLETLLPTILLTIMQLVEQVTLALADLAPKLIPIVIRTVIMLVETLLDNIDLLIDSGIQLILGLADGLLTALPLLIDKIPVIIEKLVSAISRNLPKIIAMGIELTLKLAVGIIKAIPQLVSKIPQIIAGIVRGLKDGLGSVKSVGGDLIRGLWEGISDMAGWIGGKIKGFGENVLGGIKDFFGIHSPSQVMADEVGKNLALGIGEGFADNIAGVNKQITGAMNFSGAGAVGNVGGRTGSGAVVNQYNYYSQAHSRIELYKTKQATAAAVRLAMGA